MMHKARCEKRVSEQIVYTIRNSYNALDKEFNVKAAIYAVTVDQQGWLKKLKVELKADRRKERGEQRRAALGSGLEADATVDMIE